MSIAIPMTLFLRKGCGILCSPAVRPGHAVEWAKEHRHLQPGQARSGGYRPAGLGGSEARNAPTVINAVFNFDNFWDGRASFIFNGVNPFGFRDRTARLSRPMTAKCGMYSSASPTPAWLRRLLGRRPATSRCPLKAGLSRHRQEIAESEASGRAVCSSR